MHLEIAVEERVGSGSMPNPTCATRTIILRSTLILLLSLSACDSLVPTSPEPERDPYGGTPIEAGVPPTTGGVDGLQNFEIYLSARTAELEVCAWDSGLLEDGDLVRLSFNGRSLTSGGSSQIRLAFARRCWNVGTVTGGFFYPIELTAVNEGDVPPNTGSISIGVVGSFTQDQTWQLHQGAGSRASVIARYP